MKYTATVDAIQFTSVNHDEVREFVGGNNFDSTGYPTEIWSDGEDEWIYLHNGDWIVKYANGHIQTVRFEFDARFKPA